MPARKGFLLGCVICLLFISTGCGKKTTSPKVKKETPSQPGFYDDAFLNEFAGGWVFAFLRSDTSAALKKMIACNPGWQDFFDGNLTGAIQAFGGDTSSAGKTGLVRVLLQRSRLYQDSYRAALQYHLKFLGYRQKHTKLVNASAYLIFYLGRVKLFAGDYQKAIADFSYFLRKKTLPGFQIRTKVLLGAAYYLNGDRDKAAALWRVARKEFGEDPTFKSEWGFVQGYLGLNLKKALLHTLDAWQAVRGSKLADKNYYLFNLMYLKMLNGQLD